MSEAGEAPIRVLFVCTANICRSAFAEAYARHVLGEDPTVEVSSAGTFGWEGHAMDEVMAGVLADRSVDASVHRGRRLTSQMVDEADLVLTAEVAHRLAILDSRPAAFRRVLTIGQLAETLEHVPADLRGRELVDAVGRSLRPASADGDVADPFRRGREVAESVADHLEVLLTGILSRLSRRPEA